MRFHKSVLALAAIAACSAHAAEALLLSNLNWDFESGALDGWTVVSGNLGKQPASNDNDRWGGNFNKHGRYFIGTFEDGAAAVGDTRIGEIHSPVFLVDANGIALRIGGGKNPDAYVALCDATTQSELTKASGRNAEAMHEIVLDVSPYKQKQVYLKVVDRSSAAWGHINIDFVRAATPTAMASARPAPPTPVTPATSGPKTPPVAEEKPPQPVPDAALLPEAESLVRDFFSADYAKTGVTDRAALVKKLLNEAAQTNTDMDLKYVLLFQAYEVARQSANFELAVLAARHLSKAFQVDGAKLKSDVFTKVSPSTPEGQQALLDCILSELEGAAADDRYGEALQLLGLAKGWAVKLKDTTLQTRLTAQAKDLSAGQAAFEKYEAAQQTLAGKPDDAAAHLAVGAYLCFHKQNWKTGLSHLAHGADPVLKDAASRELRKPTEATEQADLGDLWWLQAEKETGPTKGVMQQRAIVWYAEALADLPPARQAVVMKRLQTGAGSSDAVLGRIKAAGLVFFVHPAMDPTGKARDLITFAPPAHVGTVTEVAESGVKALKFATSYARYPASEAVHAIAAAGSYFVWIKHPQAAGAWAGVIFRGTAPDPNIGKGVADFSLFIYQDHFRFWLNWPENEWPGVEGKTAFVSKNPVPTGRWTMLGGTWNGSTIVLYVDGQRDRAFESTLTPIPRKFPEMVALGCDPAGSPEYYNGLISCAMIFNKALTDAEVKQLHALSGPLGLVGSKE